MSGLSYARGRIRNYPIKLKKPFLSPLTNCLGYANFDEKNKLFARDIYSTGTVLEKLVNLSKLDKSSAEYKALYEDIIKVGEYTDPVKTTE